MNFNSNEQNASLKPRNINKKYSMIDKIEKDKNIIDIMNLNWAINNNLCLTLHF